MCLSVCVCVSVNVYLAYCKPGFFRVLEIFAYFAVFRKFAKISSRENLTPRKKTFAKKMGEAKITLRMRRKIKAVFFFI